MRAARWPIRRVTAAPDAAADPGSFPANVPAVAQLLRDGLELGPATVLVGENGSGKSTLIEAIALSYGLSAEGGSTGARHSTRSSESGLWDLLTLSRNPGSTRWGYFLRAETMHGFFSYLEENPARSPEAVFHELSHGESFLELIRDRFTGAHSALLAALPGADILEIGVWACALPPGLSLTWSRTGAPSWGSPKPSCATSSTDLRPITGRGIRSRERLACRRHVPRKIAQQPIERRE